MRHVSLSRRLSLVFAALLLACVGASAWLQVRSSRQHEQLVVQRLSSDLAGHIAGNADLMTPGGWNQQAVRALFGQLMAVNPSVEVYLLSLDGRIQGQDAPPGHLKRDAVDVAPVQRLLAGEPLPILGDDPRSVSARKVFSAAPITIAGRTAGYVYVVLQGEAHDALSASVNSDAVLRTTLWSMALVAGCGLLAGLMAFRSITRPLRELTARVQTLDPAGLAALEDFDENAPVVSDDEIGRLSHAFGQMGRRIAQQWRELSTQDQRRRELVANVSHDLRTPLTSLHGYLETLLVKSDVLSDAERRRYLETALGQSRKVNRLAQELFDLARLEHGDVTPEREPFSLAELVHDVRAKFELATEARRQQIVVDIAPGLPGVNADLGMIERVLTNLLDNAIRFTPAGGTITIKLRHGKASQVAVEVSDTGPGVAEELQPTLFTRPAFPTGVRADGSSGGLGLMIVQRILQLHGSAIRLVTDRTPGHGAVFSFEL